MMTTYLESSPTTGNRRRRIRGRFRVAYGSIVVALLALAAAAGPGSNSELDNPLTPLYPPHLPVAQSILYQPLDECPFQPLFGAEDETSLHFSSRPGLTAIVGEHYEYRPTVRDLEDPDGDLRLEVKDAPGEYEIAESGQHFVFIPRSPGRYCVTISASEGRSTAYQTYRLHVFSKAHWLGTDRAGRDMIAATAAGARWALLPGLVMAILAVGLGAVVGGYGGYYGGATNDFLEFLTATVESIPALLLLFLVAVMSGFNVYVTIAALGVLWLPRTARGVKSRVTTLKNLEFVEACRELGQSNSEILWKEIIWANERNQLFAQFFHALGFAIVIEVTISYLGLGVKLPDISWGVLLKEGRDAAIHVNAYWIAAVTSIVVLVVVHGLNSLGRGLSQLLGRTADG